MADFGITPEGWNGKRLRDVLDSLETRLSTVTDPDTGETLQVDFDADDPLIQVINAFAESIAEVWDLAGATAKMFDPNGATGPFLASLVQVNGVQKRAGIKSTVSLDITGTPGTEILAGQRVSDAQQLAIWVTDQTVTLDVAGDATVTASAVDVGPTVALSGTIDTILTPVTGWDTVTNPLDAVVGRNEETDAALRARRNRSTETPSVGPVEATYGNLNQIEGVVFARAYINNTLAVDSRGIPAKSLAAVVLGGDNLEIAQTLFLRNSGGVEYFGTESEILTDLQGVEYDVRFIRPTPVNISLQIDVTVTDAGVWPSDGDTKIKEAIVAYAQGGRAALNITEGFDDTGFVPGVDVDQSRLYTPINSVPGHKVTQLLLAKTGDPLATDSIEIVYNEYAAFQSANITVNVTLP